MDWSYSPYVFPLLFTAILSAAIAYLAIRRRTVSGSRSLAVLMGFVTLWSLAYALELVNTDLSAKFFWLRVSFISILVVPVAWTAFALEYTGRDEWLSTRNLAILSIEPVAVLALIWTNNTHHLFWKSVELEAVGSLQMLSVTYGDAFWIYAAFTYMLIFASTFLIFQAFVRSPYLYRGQAAMVLIGGLIPWLGNLIYVFGLSPFPHLDLTPFAFTLSGLAVAWGLLHYRLLDVAPVARDAIFESMGDRVIVLDSQKRVVDINPSAIRDLKLPISKIIGGTSEQVFAGWVNMFPQSFSQEIERYLGENEFHEELALGDESRQLYIDLRISPLKDRRGESNGHMMIWRDITERKKVEEALRASEESYRQSVEKSPNPIFSVNREGIILSWNFACEKIFQYDQDIIGQDFRKILPVSQNQTSVDTMLTQVFEQKEALSDVDLAFRCQDGTQRFMVSRLYPLIGQDGRVWRCNFANTDITERRQAEEALRRQLEELSVLHTVAIACEEATNEAGLLERVTNIIGDTLYPANFGILLLDEENGLLRFHPAYRGISDELKSTTIPLEHGITGQVAASGQPCRVSDVTCEPRYVQLRQQTRSEVCVPVKIGERVIGVINAESGQPNAYTEADERLLNTLAGQLATAIDRLRAEFTEKKRSQQLETLYQTSQEIAANLESRQVYAATHRAVAHLMPSDVFTIGLLDEEQREVALVYIANLPEAEVGVRIPMESGLNSRVITTSQALLIDDLENVTDIDFYFFGPPPHVRSVLAVPMHYRGKTIGVLSTQSYQPRAYTLEDQQSLSTLANHVAIAIENARLFDETRQRTAHLEALNAVIAATVAAADMSSLLEIALQHLLRALGLEMGAIGLAEVYVVQGLPWESGAAFVTTHWGANLPSSGIFIVEDWREEAETNSAAEFRSMMGRFGVQASISVPLVYDNNRLGGLAVAAANPRHWSPEEIALVEGVGRQLGGAVERLNLLEKTRDQARQVQLIIDTVPEGVLLLDREQTILMANPAAKTYLSELARGDPPGMVPREGSRLVDLAGHPVEELLIREQPWVELETEGLLRRFYEAAAQPLKSRGQNEGWVLVLREVTQERENQKRIQMQERLATVGQLAAGIAHDFNNIMAAIVVYTDLLMMEPNLSSPGQERLTIIQQQVQRAASLIRQILDFSRRSVMEHSNLDLLPFIKELDKLLGRVLPETIRLELKYQPGSYVINADPTRLQQVFMNLAVNARDAMPGGGILHFELHRLYLNPGENPPIPDLTPGSWILITVADTGKGIPPEVIPHIFEPFFTTKPVGQGTGLGLAQVYGIIKQHGGSIDASSQAGQGTTFRIYLPALEIPQVGIPKVEPSVGDLKGKGETVLLVEDDWSARDALKALLEIQNYRVLTASNGMEALKVFVEHTSDIDLVISDVVMPELGGLELYRILRERDPQIRLLLITGHPLDEKDQLRLEEEPIHWLQKPFSVKELSRVVQDLLEGE